MQIILWRHAEADDNYRRDLSRKLTPKGHRQAQTTARWLRNYLPDDYLLVSSEASRAKQTAQHLSKPLIDRRFNPGSRAKHVEQALKSLLNTHVRPIVLVAHQPFLGQVASLFVRGDSMNQPVKKSGVYWLQSRGDSWYYKAILPPKLMK
ncbi:MAG: histidine phosphatase family protein [Gammaproteobacteria bacterium]|nr:MAG: histidine phosphatase family protein [Gammaproteobacteria bacterium]